MGIYISHPSSLDHDTGGHPENADRIRAIEAALESRGWSGLERVQAPPAKRDQLLRVHPDAHIDRIAELSHQGGGMIDLDTVASAASYDAALHAAGAAAHAVDLLLADSAEFAFCALRPPGHHAEAARAMGFCLFNNVAVGAAQALEEHGLERVLVLDWDVHHGNGTEAIFAGSERVLYTSIHQSPLYPGTGALSDVGSGTGEGYTVNMPVPAGAGPEQFLALVEHVVVPIAASWEAQLIAISAGYDAHADDPLADCLLDSGAYGAMTASVRDAAAGLGAPILLCLEGGYELRALAESVIATIEALNGDGQPTPVPSDFAEPYRERLRAYWPL